MMGTQIPDSSKVVDEVVREPTGPLCHPCITRRSSVGGSTQVSYVNISPTTEWPIQLFENDWGTAVLRRSKSVRRSLGSSLLKLTRRADGAEVVVRMDELDLTLMATGLLNAAVEFSLESVDGSERVGACDGCDEMPPRHLADKSCIVFDSPIQDSNSLASKICETHKVFRREDKRFECIDCNQVFDALKFYPRIHGEQSRTGSSIFSVLPGTRP